MADCVFCKIISGEVPCDKVYEDDATFAFLDISPASKGHTLVISKAHAERLGDLPLADAVALMSTLQKVGTAVGSLGDGYNVLQNNGHAAGQLVMHIHFHLIPRYTDDGVRLLTSPDKFSYTDGEKEDVKAQLTAFLQK